MTAELIVQKFGGTSVGTIERIQHVAAHIGATVQSGSRVVAVISAMGDQTDELLAMAHQISAKPPRRELDMLLTAGERIAMALVSIALNEAGTKAVSLTGSQSGIITDTIHGNARISRVSGKRIAENLDAGAVVIVAGFQGVSQETKEITTLGRGGSDLSAVALAAHLNADRCQLYKDVDGVCSADPRVVGNAKKIDRLTWDEMTEMAWCGASVLHPRGAHLAAKYGIPIEIRSSFHLDRPGTIVSGSSPMERFVVSALTHRKDMAVVTGQLAFSHGSALDTVRSWLWEQGETPQVQTQISHGGAVQFTWTMPEKYVSHGIKLLSDKAAVEVVPTVTTCALITAVGSGFWQSPELVPMIREVVSEPILLDVKNNAATIAVPSGQCERVLNALHHKLLAKS